MRRAGASPDARAGLRPRNVLLRAAMGAATALRGPLRRAGIDAPGLLALLATYLILDERRARGGADDLPDPSPFGKGFALTCALNLLVGVLAGSALLLGDPLFGMGVLLLIVLAFTAMVMVTDYSTVLLDGTDAALVAPLPVTDRTFFAARVAHIVVYVGLLMGSLALPGLVIGAIVFPAGIFVPLYVASVLLTGALGLAVAFGGLVVAVRALDLDRLKDVVLYAQVGATVLFFGGFQLAPQVLEGTELTTLLDREPWVAWLLPSCHQGGLLALALGDVSARNVGLAVVAIALPVGALIVVLRLASRGFVDGLARMATAERSSVSLRPSRSWLRDRWLRHPTARAGYDFFRALSRRERSFRLRTYPLVALALLMGLMLAIRNGRIQSPVALCGSIYIAGAYLPLFLVQARFSDTWEARWLLQTAPLADPGKFANGAMVALVWTLLLPTFVLLLAVVVAVGGTGVLLDASFATLLMLLAGAVNARLFGAYLPFTEKASRTAARSALGPMLASLFACGVMVGSHALLRHWPWLLAASMVAIAVALVLVTRSLARLRVRPIAS